MIDRIDIYPGALRILLLRKEFADDAASASEATLHPRLPDVASERSELTSQNTRVFVAHGRNKEVLRQIKRLLLSLGFDPIIAEERESTSQPVPEKILEAMRSCSAGVLHVGGEGTVRDRSSGKSYRRINDNVLIEIGVAMAVYGRNFVLLVEEGVRLPSNLQGLYECRYKGRRLDEDAFLKLVGAARAAVK